MRNIEIFTSSSSFAEQRFEIVERKGMGHPDTLSDALAEQLSIVYSKYTKERYGAILHHNFDKVGMMGGMSEVVYNGGKMLKPIRVLLNGRASSAFGGEKIDVKDMLVSETKKFFSERFPMLDVEKDITYLFEVSFGSSPGGVKGSNSKRHYWFEPRSLDDISELKFLACNDTSMGCAYAGNSALEALVLEVENKLNSIEYKKDKPWMGNDIKIMAFRHDNEVNLTMAVPQICLNVNSVEEYKFNLETVRQDVLNICKQKYSQFKLNLFTNMRDKFSSENVDMYLTFTGSSIETGDEGFVGRGNRIGGLITPTRPYTMEGICGKNPVYHTGKMYCIASFEIAEKINSILNKNVDVFLIGQSGQSLTSPWKTVIRLDPGEVDMDKIREIVECKLDEIPTFTEKILKGHYRLF